MTTRRAFITGGAGFIGTYLTRLLLEKDHFVTVIDREPSTEFLTISHPRLKLVRENIFEDQDLGHRIQESDSIFHLSAQPSVQICEKNPAESHRDNFESTKLILDKIKIASTDGKWRKLAFTSTSAVYGDVVFKDQINEHLPCSPISHYGKDKLRSENAIFQAAISNPLLSVCVFRLFNVYGLGQKAGSPYSGVMTKFFNRVQSNQPLIIFGDGKQIRDFIHVKDVANALYLGSLSEGFSEPMNVASGMGITIRELADIFSKMNNTPIVHEAAQSGDIRISVGNPSRIQTKLNWKPSVDLEKGIHRDFQL